MVKTAKLASPVNPGAGAKEVLVIKLSALGDFVLALGAMKAVREFHPSARITLLTTPPFEDLASHCPYFDRVETDGRPATMKATTALLNRIRKSKYDIIYDFQTSGRTKNYFTALSRTGKAPLWSGHHEKAAFFHDNPERAVMHSIDRLAEQLAVAGVAPEGRWNRQNFPKPDLSWVRPKLRDAPRLQPAYFGLEQPYMLLIPGASEHREAKRWPVERFAELAKRVADAGVTPAIIGGKAEGRIAQDIMKLEKRAKSLVTRTDLFQIVTLAEKAAFVVGNDTGPMHMAAIAGAPGVALFATNESNPDHAAPRGARSPIINSAPTLAELEIDTVWRSILALGVLPT